jgi:hypothetical protein
MSEGAGSPISSNNESRERDLNRHRVDEERRARTELSDRLSDRGITIGAIDSDEDVVELWEAVEAFERAVEAHGGDLMIDTPPAEQPDDPRFVIPRREGSESLGALRVRIEAATSRLSGTRAD